MEQAFVYKGGKAELHNKDVADRMKADEGWFDNPADALEADGKAPAATEAEEVPDNEPAPESVATETSEESLGAPEQVAEPEDKSIIGAIKGFVGSGAPAEEPAVEVTPETEPEE